jgi:hypothetical protein
MSHFLAHVQVHFRPRSERFGLYCSRFFAASMTPMRLATHCLQRATGFIRVLGQIEQEFKEPRGLAGEKTVSGEQEVINDTRSILRII